MAREPVDGGHAERSDTHARDALGTLDWRSGVKVVACNGREFTVRDCGDILVRLIAPPGGMVKHHGTRIVNDDEARRVTRELLNEGAYERTA